MFFMAPFIFAASLITLPFQVAHGLLGHQHYKDISTMAHYKRAFQSERPSIMMFSAPWCGPCKSMKPNFDSVAGMHNRTIDFYVVNTDAPGLKSLIQKHNIRGLPTVLCTRNGKVIHEERRGAMSKNEVVDCVHTFNARLAAQGAPKAQKKAQATKKLVKHPTVKKAKSYKKPLRAKKAKKARVHAHKKTKGSVKKLRRT
jgi:thioredoxin-like negative regulator of GroEL